MQESSFGIAGEGGVVGFVICHQGAELLSAKGEKMGILVVFGILRLFRAHKGSQDTHKACAGILGSARAHALDFCPPQVYAISVQGHPLDFCSPQVYASTV